MSVITALTAQNTTGVFGVQEVTPDFVAKQIDAVFTDIRPDAVKIGMVLNVDIISVIAEKLAEYKATNIVLDPVMISTSGCKLLSENAIGTLIKKLFPLSDIITPNILEAECLSKILINTKADMIKSAEIISQKYDGSILIKGGHLKNSSDDLLYSEVKYFWFERENINNPNTHGTGCTLSSAIACNLANGCTMEESVFNAKAYITGAIKANLDLGKGSGPLNHCY